MRPIHVLRLENHLTLNHLRDLFAGIEPMLLEAQAGIIIDARRMSGYATEARDWFADSWAPRWADRVIGIGVVTGRVMWRIVVTALGLTTRIKMRAFDEIVEAHSWLTDLEVT